MSILSRFMQKMGLLKSDDKTIDESKLNTAQRLLFSWLPENGFGNAYRYRAPHAYRPTTPRNMRGKTGRGKLPYHIGGKVPVFGGRV